MSRIRSVELLVWLALPPVLIYTPFMMRLYKNMQNRKLEKNNDEQDTNRLNYYHNMDNEIQFGAYRDSFQPTENVTVSKIHNYKDSLNDNSDNYTWGITNNFFHNHKNQRV
eukprot:755995_1